MSINSHVAQEFVQRAENLATLVPGDETALEQFKKVAHDAIEKVEALLHIEQTKVLAIQLMSKLSTTCTNVVRGISDHQHFTQAAKDELKQLADRTQSRWNELLANAGSYAPILKAQAGLDQIRGLLDQAWSASLVQEIHGRMNDVITLVQTTMPSEARVFITPFLEQLSDITNVLKQKLTDAKNTIGDDATALCNDMLQKMHAYASQYTPTIQNHVQHVTEICANNEKVKAVRNAAIAVSENPIIRDQVKPELFKLKSDISTEIYSNDAFKQKLIVIAFIVLAFVALTVKSIAQRFHEYATSKVIDLKAVPACKSSTCTTTRTTAVKHE